MVTADLSLFRKTKQKKPLGSCDFSRGQSGMRMFLIMLFVLLNGYISRETFQETFHSMKKINKQAVAKVSCCKHDQILQDRKNSSCVLSQVPKECTGSRCQTHHSVLNHVFQFNALL